MGGCCKHLFPGEDILLSQTSCSWFVSGEDYLDRLKTVPIHGVKKGTYANMATQYALHTSRGKQTNLLKYYNRGKLGVYSYGVPEVFYSNGLTTDEVSANVQAWLNDNVSVDLPDQMLISDRIDVPTDLEWIVFLSNELSYKNDNNNIYLTKYLFVDMDGVTVRIKSKLTSDKLKFLVTYDDDSTSTVILDSMQTTSDYTEVRTTNGSIIKFPLKQVGLHYVFGVQYDNYRTYVIIDYIEGEHPNWEYIVDEINTTLTTMPVTPIKLDGDYNEDGWVSENVSPDYKEHDSAVMEYKFDDPNRTHDMRQQLDKIGISLDGITTQIIEANKFGERKIVEGTDPAIIEKIERNMHVFSLEQKHGYAKLNTSQKQWVDQYSVYLEPLEDYQDNVDALDQTRSIFVSYALDPFSLNREVKKAMFLTWEKLYILNEDDDKRERRIKITEGVFNKVIRWRGVRHAIGPGDELGCTSIEYDMDFREVVIEENDPGEEEDNVVTAEFIYYVKYAVDDAGNRVLIEEFGLSHVDFYTVITSEGLRSGNTYDIKEENRGKIAIPLFYDVFIAMNNNFEKEILEQKSKYMEVYVSEVQHLYWYQTKTFAKILSIAMDLYAIVGIIASAGTATPAIEIVKNIIKKMIIRELVKQISSLVLKELIKNISNEVLVAILYGVYLYEVGEVMGDPTGAMDIFTGSYSAYAQKKMYDLSEEQKTELEKYTKREKELEEMQLELQTIIVGAAYESPEKFYNRTTALPLSLNLTVDKDAFSVYD